MVLYNNNLSDDMMASLLETLAEIPNGLKVFGIIQNRVGKKSLDALCDLFIPSTFTNTLQKIIIKDPINSGHPFSNSRFMQVLSDNVSTLPRLKQVVLQNVGLKEKDLIIVSHFVTDVSALRFLNISGNGLTPEDFIHMFSIMKPQSYSLVKLNLSWNSAVTANQEVQKRFD